VEHVQPESTVGLPVVHGLPRDEREALVDGELRDGPILDAVRPAPEHLPVAEVGEVGGERLRQRDDVGGGDDRLARVDGADERGELRVWDAEALAVSVLEHDRRPQILVDPLEMRRVDRQALLVGLAGGGQHPESQE
jgi:hypothetical protein